MLISQVYEELRPQLMAFLRHRLNDEDLAEDLTQDCFVRILEMDGLLLPATIRSLVFTIARNLLFDYLRRQRKNREIWEQLYYETPATHASVEQEVHARDLERTELCIVSQLPERRRKVYELARFEEQPTAEIALRLGMNKRTADTHLFLSRRAVREYLHACGF